MNAINSGSFLFVTIRSFRGRRLRNIGWQISAACVLLPRGKRRPLAFLTVDTRIGIQAFRPHGCGIARIKGQ